VGIEDAVLWTGFITGILGAIGFFWQISQSLSRRREESNKSLNENVVRPWSELQVKESFGPRDDTGLRLWIPKESLPENAAPSISTDGLDLTRLPGLARGETFLQKRDPQTFSSWLEVKSLSERFATVRRHRRIVIQSLVRNGMAELGVALKDVRWEDWGPNTYIFDNIVAQVEDTAYFAVKYGRPGRSVSISRTASGEMIFLEVGGGYSLLKVPEDRKDVAEIFANRLASWTSDTQVWSDSVQMVEVYAELEKAVENFRSALKEIAVSIDMTGG
jgi:hypothetical protein